MLKMKKKIWSSFDFCKPSSYFEKIVKIVENHLVQWTGTLYIVADSKKKAIFDCLGV